MQRIRCVALGMLLLVTLAGLPGCFQASPEEQKATHLKQGQSYFDHAQYPEARIEYLNVVQLDPKDAHAHYTLALIYLHLNGLHNLQDAFRELRSTVTLNPAHHDAHVKLGELYLLAREPAKARQQADLLLAAAPHDPEATVLRGQSYLGEQRFDKAIADFTTALALDPHNIRVYLVLAQTYVQIKNLAAAESTLQQALTAKADSVEARLAFGDLQMLRGHAHLAETEYKKAVAIAPTRPETQNKLAAFYVQTNRLADAEATYLTWATAQPQDETPLVGLGDVYRFTGQPDKSLATYQRALTVNPKSLPARHRHITVLIETGKLDEAETLIHSMLESNSRDVDGRLFDGRAKLARGNIKEALRVLSPLRTEEPLSPAAHHFLGLAYAANNERGQAVTEFREAIKLSPTAVDSHAALASMLLSQESPDLAIGEAQEALRLNPRYLPAAMVLGDAYLKKNDAPKARQVFEAIARAVPNSALAHHRLGLIARTEKKDPEALAHFEQALTAAPEFLDPLVQIVAITLRQGKPGAAHDRLIQQRERAPRNPDVQVLLGQFLVTQQQYEPAEAAFRNALELNDDMLSAYTGLAALYLRMGKVDHAMQEYERALTKNPKLVSAITMLGMIHESRKEYDRAQARYEEAMHINPRFAPAANNLAWLMLEHGGNIDKALGYARTAREILPSDPSIADTVGWLYYHKKAYLWAASFLKEAAEKLPENSEVLYHYGMVLHHNGKTHEAQQWLKRSLKLNPQFPGAEEARRTLERSEMS